MGIARILWLRFSKNRGNVGFSIDSCVILKVHHFPDEDR
ncbi:hypothetical protein MNBD_GAMMA16-1872 [hydrothermal vent metagenome]|uniref:Uncharacterized protein n=1 Tax=hydrothermal vent metagenome TaxID=652676 RepID=A0A3B0YZU2_9ZZZZ